MVDDILAALRMGAMCDFETGGWRAEAFASPAIRTSSQMARIRSMQVMLPGSLISACIAACLVAAILSQDHYTPSPSDNIMDENKDKVTISFAAQATSAASTIFPEFNLPLNRPLRPLNQAK